MRQRNVCHVCQNVRQPSAMLRRTCATCANPPIRYLIGTRRDVINATCAKNVCQQMSVFHRPSRGGGGTQTSLLRRTQKRTRGRGAPSVVAASNYRCVYVYGSPGAALTGGALNMKINHLDHHPPKTRGHAAPVLAPKAGLCATCALACKQPDLAETLRCPRFMLQERMKSPPTAPKKGV